MKQSLRKVVSILLVAMLLVSALPTMLFTVSAEDAETQALKELGVWKADSDGVSLATDPAGSGENVIKFYQGGTGTGFVVLKDPVSDKKFEPIAEHYYTITFEYYSVKSHSIRLDYGNHKYLDSGDDGRVTVSLYRDFYTSTGYDANHAGDGQWHTITMSFKSRLVMGSKISTSVLKNLMLAAQGNGGFEMYIKNINIVDNGVAATGVYGAKSSSGGNGSIVADPAGGEEKVVAVNNGRVVLTNNNRDVTHFQPDTQYTVKFDYYVDTTGTFDFYGTKISYDGSAWGSLENSHSGSNGDWGMKVINSAKSTYNSAFAGDGQWHTYYYSFKVDSTDTTAYTGNITNDNSQTTSDGTIGQISVNKLAIYKNLVVQFSGKAYIKNVEIHAGGKYIRNESPAINKALDITTAVKTSDGGATYSVASGGSGSYKGYGVGKDGDDDYVMIQGNGQTSDSTSGDRWLHSINVENYEMTHGRRYTMTFQYKVASSNGSYIQLAAASTLSGSNRGMFYGETGKLYIKDTEWRTYTHTFVVNDNGQSYNRSSILILCGSATDNTEVWIKNVTLTSDTHYTYTLEDNAVKVTVNDNGQTYTYCGWKGETIPYTGMNAENVALGETRMGWYTDAQLTVAADGLTVPADLEGNEYSVYAKYPTTILDFNVVNLVKMGYDYNTGLGWFNMGEGKVVVNNVAGEGSVGFMMPAYDADLPNGTSSSYYKFTVDKKYRVKYFVDSTSSTDGGTSARFFTLTPANQAGPGGSRDTATGCDTEAIMQQTPYTVSSTYTFATGSQGFQTVVVRIGGNSQGTEFHDVTHVVDKIYITTMDDDSFAAGGYIGQYTLDYKDGVTGTEKVDIGGTAVHTLPIPTRQGYIFAGWYDSDIDKIKSIEEVAVSAVNGAECADKKYTAQWVKDEVVKIDFLQSEGYTSKTYGKVDLDNHTAYDSDRVSITYEKDENGDYVLDDEGNKIIKSKSVSSTGNLSSTFSVIQDLPTELKTQLGAEFTSTGFAHFDNVNGNNSYKISLLSNGKFQIFEGMTYEIKIGFMRVRTGNEKSGQNYINDVGVTRNSMYSFCPNQLDNPNGSLNVFDNTNAVDTAFREVTQTITVDGVYVATNQSEEGGADKICDELSLCIKGGEVYVDYVTIKPISYQPENIDAGIENGKLEIDYANNTVKVIPDGGYELKAGSLKTTMLYRDWDYSDNGKMVEAVINNPTIIDMFTTDGVNYTFKDSANNLNNYSQARLNALQFTAEFVAVDNNPTKDVNGGFIAMSKREDLAAGVEGNTTGEYQSAGIRFRSRLTKTDVNNAQKIEYLVVPELMLTKTNCKSIQEYVTEGNTKYVFSGIALDRTGDTVKETVYEQIGNVYTDYQAVITGLTQEGNNSHLKNVKFKVALAITKADGSMQYIEYANACSYN